MSFSQIVAKKALAINKAIYNVNESLRHTKCLRFFANTNVKPFIFEQNSGILEHRHIDYFA